MNHISQIIEHLEAHRDAASVPAAARAAAKMFMRDSMGVALAGARVAESRLVATVVAQWGLAPQGGARVWGSTQTLPAPSAALRNAFHIHNQEFDCVHERAVVHPMAVILAALGAYAERAGGVSGTRFLAALALAVDVATVIGMSATRPIRFFRPAQCGCLGATAGIAWLGGFSEQQTRDAMGLAYSQLAGTMQAHIEGTPALALQVAFAARAAVCAADLAAVGFRGPHDVLDGRYGYFALIEDGAASPTAPFAELGQVWQITRVAHKPYPTGRAAQGGISGLIKFMQQHALSAGDIESVTLFAPPLIRQLVDRPYQAQMPVNYARLCLPYLLALVLRDGRVGLDAYTAANLSADDLAKLSARVGVQPDANTDPNALAPQRLLVKTRAGQTFAIDMPHVYGAPEARMSEDAQRQKFVDCCRAAPEPLDDHGIAALQAAIDDIETCADVREVFARTIPNTPQQSS
ncbi:MAG: MmgE/PrpD family protein [Burkholderiales bacterium]|jgi:2-methylcitrate dehydratase PrpD|nr:MmgE/PrpD family protein [Nitrosomonadaceae bacterium]